LVLKERMVQLAQLEHLLCPSARSEPQVLEPLAPNLQLAQPELLLDRALIQLVAHSEQWL
jgi:hypothetical protein